MRKPYIGIVSPFSAGEGIDRTFTRCFITKQNNINEIWTAGGIPITLHLDEDNYEFNEESLWSVDALFIPKCSLLSYQLFALKYALNKGIPILLEDNNFFYNYSDLLKCDYSIIRDKLPSNSSQSEILDNDLETKLILIDGLKCYTDITDVYNKLIKCAVKWGEYKNSVYKREKPIVGVLPQRSDIGITKTVYTYPNCIFRSGGIPVTIHMPTFDHNVKFEVDAFDEIDSILIPGGSLILPEQICAVKYAISEGKPLIGICAGTQVMGAYNWLKIKYGDLDYDKIIDQYNVDIDEANFIFKIEKGHMHNYTSNFYKSMVNNFLHSVFLIGKLSKIYEKEYLISGVNYSSCILAPSIHNWALNKDLLDDPKSLFEVTGFSDDGIVEAIQYKNNSNIIGVQYHPELIDESRFIKKDDGTFDYVVSHRALFDRFITDSIIYKNLNERKFSLKIK